jgi:hypothetical protein
MKEATGIFVTPDRIEKAVVSDHRTIHDLVGDWFDCVVAGDLVGYVHDSGLINGLPINPVATAVFGQIIAGPCVIVRSLNEQGERDGYDHSLSVDDIVRVQYAWNAYAMWMESVTSGQTS